MRWYEDYGLAERVLSRSLTATSGRNVVLAAAKEHLRVWRSETLDGLRAAAASHVAVYRLRAES